MISLGGARITIDMEARILKCCVLLSILLGAFGHSAVAKNTILHCQGYQPNDRHKLAEEIITLDIQNNVVVSIQLSGSQPRDIINAPIKSGRDVLEWSYDAVNMRYFFNRQNSRLRLFSKAMVLLGIFECRTS